MLTGLTQCTSKWKSFDTFVNCNWVVTRWQWQTFGSNSVLLLKFLTAEKVPPIEIHRRMQAVYGDQCADVSTVRRCVRRFKDGELGQADLSDKTRSGRISETSAALAEVC